MYSLFNDRIMSWEECLPLPQQSNSTLAIPQSVTHIEKISVTQLLIKTGAISRISRDVQRIRGVGRPLRDTSWWEMRYCSSGTSFASFGANPPREEDARWVTEVCGSDTWAWFMTLHAPWCVVSITLTEWFKLPVLIQIIKQECVVFGWPHRSELSSKVGILKVFHDEVMCSPMSVYWWLVGLSAGLYKIDRTYRTTGHFHHFLMEKAWNQAYSDGWSH